MFTSEFSDKEALLKEVRDLEIFKDHDFLPTEESFKGFGLRDEEFDKILADNIDEFGKTAREMIEFRLKKKYQRKIKLQQHTIEELKAVIQQRKQISGRHRLNYAKLYHNHHGGYSMEKLKKVMQRLSEDREDGLHRHPFLDPKESEILDEKLR